LRRNQKKTLGTAFLLCILFEVLAGIAHPNYSQAFQYPIYTEPVFIICQAGSIIFTIYFLSLTELCTVEYICKIKAKNSFTRKFLNVILPVLTTLVSFAAVLFIRGTITTFILQMTASTWENAEPGTIISTSFNIGIQSLSIDHYISRVFQAGDIVNTVFVNVIDHILRYIEPGLILLNVYFILANPLSELKDQDWFEAVSRNPKLVQKVEVNDKDLHIYVQNIFEIDIDSDKHRVALGSDDIHFWIQDTIFLICMICLYIASLAVGLYDNVAYKVMISIVHPIIFVCLCWGVIRLRERSNGRPKMYEIASFSNDYRVMKLIEPMFNYSQNDVEEYYHIFKNEKVLYLSKNQYISESDVPCKKPWMIMGIFVAINIVMINTLPSWLYLMPVGVGDVLLFSDVLYKSTKPNALGFIKRYLMDTSLIYIVLLCTRLF